jgi:hypothetical protein
VISVPKATWLFYPEHQSFYLLRASQFQDASGQTRDLQYPTVVDQLEVAALGMKSLSGSGELVREGAIVVTMGLRYAMSLPVAVTISGIDSLDVLHQNLAVARNFQPMNAAEMQAIRDACRSDAADGHLELFKTTKKYDGDLGREMHGFPSGTEVPV